MRKQMIWAATLTLVLAAASTGVATAAKKPVTVREGNLILTFNGDVFPVALPEDRPAPITLWASGDIDTVDGSQPPALREVVLETAKDGYVNAEGLPACSIGKLEAEGTAAAERACAGSIVGRGHTTVRVAFPEQAPFSAKGPVVAFNGGISGGVTTLLLHSYIAVPSPTAVVTTVKIRKVHNGPYGLRSVATIPVIAGGAGSLTHFDLVLHREFEFHGQQRSYLTGECTHDSLLARSTDVFASGDRVTGTLVRPCKVRK